MLLNKLLWKSNRKAHFVGAFAGSLLGLILLLVSVQLYIDFRDILTSGEKLLQPEYLVINKKVSLFKAFQSSSCAFGKKDIEEISAQPFVSGVAPFVANAFKVSAYTNQTRNIPAFYTELFFESVEDRYLDIAPEDWGWTPTSPYVPIILPKDYLNLYNFGFSESQGLPKISEGMIGMVTFTLRIQGKGKEQELSGKIIGFSNRINSILVPYSFMKWANANFGENNSQDPQRLIIVAKNPSDPRIVEFLNAKNYETNTEKLKNSKLLVVLNVITTVVSGIAVLIVFLSFMNFLLGFQILIFKSLDKIKLLLHLGYTHTRIQNLYVRYYIAGMLIISALSFVAVYFIKQQLTGFLVSMKITGGGSLHMPVLIVGLSIVVTLIVLNYLNLSRQLKRIDKNH